MKSIIVYFSLTGNTKKLGVKIYEILKKENFKPELFEIEIKEKHNFIRNCIDAIKKRTVQIEKIPLIEKFDLIFIGSPVWAGSITPAVRSFIKETDFSGKDVFLFTTYGSGLLKEKAMKEFEEMVKEKNGKIIGKIEIKGKKIEEEKEEIEKCLKELIQKMHQQQ